MTKKSEQHMAQLIVSAKETVERINEIASASNEQANGIQQINQTVLQLDETTQKNAALVEKANAAARSFEGQVNQVYDAVAIFKLPAQQQFDARPAHHQQSQALTPTATATAYVSKRKPIKAVGRNSEPNHGS
jgi:methyl-accepting chemotaxis protein